MSADQGLNTLTGWTRAKAEARERDRDAKIKALEAAMLRLLEAGAELRKRDLIPAYDTAAYDEAASAAKGLVGK